MTGKVVKKGPEVPDDGAEQDGESMGGGPRDGSEDTLDGTEDAPEGPEDDEDFDKELATVATVKKGANISQTFMIFLFMMTIIVIVDPSMRESAGLAVGSILEPLIGFDGRYPVYTLMCASVLMVGFSSFLRHFFTDWFQTARSQKIMSAYQKEMREARVSGNQARIKKLMEVQGDIMKYQSSVMMTSMKSMVFTTIVAISIFTWLFTFFHGLEYSYISLPWAGKWSMMDNPYMLPNWVLVYSLVSIPTGQLIMRVLKIIEFRPRGRGT